MPKYKVVLSCPVYMRMEATVMVEAKDREEAAERAHERNDSDACVQFVPTTDWEMSGRDVAVHAIEEVAE